MARPCAADRIPYSVNHYLCPPAMPLSEFLDAVVRHGFSAVGLTQRALDEMAPGQIARELRARELRVSSINSAGYFLGDGPEVQAQRHRNEALLQVAEELGQGILNVIVGGSMGQPLPQARRRAAEHVRQFAQRAADRGVRLMLEPMNPMNVMHRSCLNGIDQALAWREGLPAVSVNLDAFHVWWDPGLQGVLEGHAPVGLYQVCDVYIDAVTGISRRMPLGEGSLDWAQALREVRHAYPDIDIELELFAEQHPGRDPIDILARCAESLRNFEEENVL